MAVKGTKVPKVFTELSNTLGEVSSSAIVGLESAVRKRAFRALSHHLKVTDPDSFAKYKEVRTDAERREWLCSYVLDPKDGKNIGRNATVVSNSAQKENSTSGSRSRSWHRLSTLTLPSTLRSQRQRSTAALTKTQHSRPQTSSNTTTTTTSTSTRTKSTN